MYCKQCGKNNPDGNTFCTGCGKPLFPKPDNTYAAATQSIVCPQCGNKNLTIVTETNTQTTGKNFSAGQGCLGYLLLGPLGILCGSCGNSQKTTSTNTTYWVCNKCGKKFKHFDDLEKEIKHFKTGGLCAFIISIITFICSIIFAIGLQEVNAVVVFIILIAVLELIGAIYVKITAEKSKQELTELKEQMRKFQ